MMQGRQINNETFFSKLTDVYVQFWSIGAQTNVLSAIFRRTAESRTLEILLFRVELAETVHNPLATCPKRSQC